MEVHMSVLVIILSIIIFVKTVSYGIYELKSKNKIGGISVIIVATFALVLPNLMIFIQGV